MNIKAIFFIPLLIISCSTDDSNENIQNSSSSDGLFYLADDGLTCMCPDADFGDTGTLVINGEEKTFTKRTEEVLKGLINTDNIDPQITLTCTSGITMMSDFGFSPNFNQKLHHWDVSNVTDMSRMFDGAISFNQPLNNWDVSNVNNMAFMFAGAEIFNQPIDDWNVSNVTILGYMFRGASSFNQPLNSWDVSNVNDMAAMFKHASNFNQPLNNWDVSNVTGDCVIGMSELFRSAVSFNQDISNWCVVGVPSKPCSFDFNSPLEDNPDFLPNWGEPCN